MRRIVWLLFALSLLAPGAAAASEERPTVAELEREVMCPVCATTLELSDSPAADQIRREIVRGIESGQTKSEIKANLVAQFGEGILAAPPREGFNLLAWALPLAGGLAAVLALGYAARRWIAGRGPEGAAPSGPNGRADVLDPDLERRLDEELARFDA
ncbi:MAG TPA: cytochrome c-type biogenesis protein [Gaiellaceae bacterium]|jgi:cytochrome c-type biogenesis protein CcmH|nr:cytochrome c-type biogenesis protein [Gaiellaceae bacterium]